MRSGLGEADRYLSIGYVFGFAGEWFASVHGVAVDLTMNGYAYRAR